MLKPTNLHIAKASQYTWHCFIAHLFLEFPCFPLPSHVFRQTLNYDWLIAYSGWYRDVPSLDI